MVQFILSSYVRQQQQIMFEKSCFILVLKVSDTSTPSQKTAQTTSSVVLLTPMQMMTLYVNPAYANFSSEVISLIQLSVNKANAFINWQYVIIGTILSYNSVLNSVGNDCYDAIQYRTQPSPIQVELSKIHN